MKKKNQKNKEADAPVIYGDPVYDADEDIYAREKKIELKEAGDDSGDLFDQEINPGAGLDVPGAEIDNRDEGVGSEDEEEIVLDDVVDEEVVATDEVLNREITLLDKEEAGLEVVLVFKVVGMADVEV